MVGPHFDYQKISSLKTILFSKTIQLQICVF